MAIFNRRDIQSRNIFQKVFKSNSKENFIIEIENLLADYENSLDSISASNVNRLAEQYKVDLSKDFIGERTELFTRMLNKALSDNKIDDNEYRELKHFLIIIKLPENLLEDEINDLGSKIYRKKLEAVFADEYISDQEKVNINKLKNDLRLSDSAATSIYRDVVRTIMDQYTKPIFESEVYSPNDEDRIYSAAKSLGLNLTFPQTVQAKLAKYRQNWEILNGKLPILKSDIHLQTGEILHHVQQINWLEERTETTRINYSGFSYSTKIIDNLKWKAGTIAPQRITQDVWKNIDSGQLFLTSKRIIFNGQHGNKVIPYSKILHFEPYSNGIQIQKDSGKSPFFEFSDEVPIFAAILNQLIGKN